MNKIYVAAPVCEQMRARWVADLLKDEGAEITSSWLYAPEIGYGKDSEERLKIMAERDLVEISNSDIFLQLSLPGSPGGMHVELGYAMAFRKRIFVVGFRQHVFHRHPDLSTIFIETQADFRDAAMNIVRKIVCSFHYINSPSIQNLVREID